MGQIIGEGITFDDVLLVPSYSQVVPNQVDLTTRPSTPSGTSFFAFSWK
jgi:IMP dehydrogenase/GMP reductase